MGNESTTVACIGLGKMGAALAHRLQQAGWRLVVYNRSPERTRPFVEAGASAAVTPREAAARADVIVSSLLDDDSVLAAVSGPNGLLAGIRPGAVHAGATTISPRASAALAELHRAVGANYVAARAPCRAPRCCAAGPRLRASRA